MAEHIDSTTPFSSAGHRWQWGESAVVDKRLGAVGTDGEISIRLRRGARPGIIAGLLKASGTSRDDADDGMTLLEFAIEGLIGNGGDYAAEDDQHHVIASLTVDRHQRLGPRQYAHEGSTWWCLQDYACHVTALTGEVLS